MLRLGAIAIALLPVALALLLRHLPWGAWVGPGLAIAGGVALTLARPRVRALVLLGTMLAVLASLAAPQLLLELGDERSLDLRTDAVPPTLEGPVAVTGLLREEWTLAEYAVPQGALPDQDAPAEAILVPLLGVEEGPVPLRDAVVVVRIRPGTEHAPGPRTLRGLAQPLDPELLSAFVQASGVEPPPGLRGVLVDAIDQHPSPPWLRGLLVALASLGALVCLWIAASDGGTVATALGARRRRPARADQW